MPHKATEAEIKRYLQTLLDTPQLLTTWTQGLDEAQLKTPPAPKEWSLVEILAHLRACADVWTYSIYAMLMLDKPTLTHIHPRDWMKFQGYTTLSFAENFLAYSVGRDNLVRILEPLSMDQWERSCTFIGRHNTFTVFGETMRMALHELDHRQQIKAMLSTN